MTDDVLPCATVCIKLPSEAAFQARLLSNQEGVNTERYASGKLSARDVSDVDLFRHRHYSNCGDIDHGKIGPGVCGVVYTVVPGVR